MDDKLNQIKQLIIPVLKSAGVSRSSIFGSYARGDFNVNSDIDLLVNLPDGNSLTDLVRLERKLKNVLNIDVDLLTYNSVHPLIKDRVFSEQYQILPTSDSQELHLRI
ncbi:MAG: nucleotidyltransferase family protein [Patescibacteria group bacterium]